MPENIDRSPFSHEASDAHLRAIAADEADRVLTRFCRDRLDLDLDDSNALRSFRSDIEFAHRGRLQIEARAGFWRVAYIAGVTAMISAVVTYLIGVVSALIHFGKLPND